MTNKPVCVVVGVGPGNGAALARRFSKEGYRIALLARTTDFINQLANELQNAKAYSCDVTDATDITRTFEQIRSDIGEVNVLIYNAGSGVWGNIEEVTPDTFESAWRVNALGLFMVGQQVIPSMKNKQDGSIIIIGATSSRRGKSNTVSFAPAKAAQRSLAESMARYLWPHKIHVALIIVDGVVDLPKSRKFLPEKSDDFFIQPGAVAATAYWLTEQPSSAWSFEVEARPFAEVW